MQKYVVLNKAVGETPLEVAETWRRSHTPHFENTPLAYAGRLDPMASGKLLVLIGDECKQQTNYHNLDKGYDFSVLCGVATDTADVLGLIQKIEVPTLALATLPNLLTELTGPVELPYPHFSSKTVNGKPLHTWTLEGRLSEITIPTKASIIYTLTHTKTETKTGADIYQDVSQKIETIAPVTDPKKALGNDFRRPEVRKDWQSFLEQHATDAFTIIHLHCVASSGTYMRTLAEVIATRLGTVGLAYHIHRTDIGHYQKFPLIGGLWTKRYR